MAQTAPKKVGLTVGEKTVAQPYIDALREAGLEPVRISPESPCGLEGLDGLVLAGGTDVNPAMYGEQAQPQTDQPDQRRDELEARLLGQALEADLPVLAICRGMQLFNVVQGGSLVQHLDSAARHRVVGGDRSQGVHSVRPEPASKLEAILGSGEVRVNSRHHQAVREVAPGLKVAAQSDDGVVEAIEHPERRFAVAVQWHPEDQRGEEHARRLFQAFRDAL